jgi:serine/threonine-protein kinase
MEVMSKHLQAAPVPPSARVAFTIPPQLEQLVLACLAKKPDERPQSAAALVLLINAMDLEPWTNSQAEEWWAAAAASSGNGETGPELPPTGPGGDSVTREASIPSTGC